MSYTLRGRVESRLAALLPVVLAACVLAAALHRWWPVEAAGLMLGLGLALDLQAYHPLLRYQPGWFALPLGLLELGLVLLVMRALAISAPLGAALLLFAAGWLCAQVLGHAGFPLLRLGYAEDGGESAVSASLPPRSSVPRSSVQARPRTRCGRPSCTWRPAFTTGRS
jgi:hypothetical protein